MARKPRQRRNGEGTIITFKSKGKITLEVQAARRDEQIAFNNLPPDRRTIIVIVSEVARGGLTQAVLSLEDAHARIDDALNGALG